MKNIEKYLGKDERGIKVKEKVKVYIEYFKEWKDDEGKIKY